MSGGDKATFDIKARGLRVGIPHKLLWEDLSPDVERAMNESLEKLEDVGCILVKEDLPVDVSNNFESMFGLCTEIYVDDLTAYLKPHVEDPNNPLTTPATGAELIELVSNPVSKEIMHSASTSAPKDVLDGIKAGMANQRKGMADYFKKNKLDCAWYPAAPQTAIPLAWGDMKGIEIYKLRFNVATFNSLPAVAVPVANSDTDGLPIGGEVLGGPNCDRRVLHVAEVFEGILGHIKPPELD